MAVSDHIVDAFAGRVRSRVCGITIINNSILLINHKGLNEQNEWWAPPGGGVMLGETLSQALIREFKEETGLCIKVNHFQFITEYIQDPLHAIELFFQVDVIEGELKTGVDPELSLDKQSINEVKYVTFEELAIIPNEFKHLCLRGITDGIQLLSEKGYLHNQDKNIK